MKDFDLDAFRSRIIPAENEITSTWNFHAGSPLVSIICISYNQERYIDDAIRGFLIQETNFPFEIIIHDDASTDSTSDKIKEYAELYPAIIKTIIQEKNKYSECPNSVLLIPVGQASGDYIAFCEGDDFWIDSSKLQNQFDVMQNNPEINIVISKAISLFPNGDEEVFCDLGGLRKVIPFEECILGPDKDFFPTATFFIRRSEFNKFPDWFSTLAPVGDYYMQLFSSYPVGCMYLPFQTAVYRRDASGSWSSARGISSRIVDQTKRYECGQKLLAIYGRDKKFKKALNVRCALYSVNLIGLHLRQRNFIKCVVLLFRVLKVSPGILIKRIADYLRYKMCASK